MILPLPAESLLCIKKLVFLYVWDWHHHFLTLDCSVFVFLKNRSIVMRWAVFFLKLTYPCLRTVFKRAVVRSQNGFYTSPWCHRFIMRALDWWLEIHSYFDTIQAWQNCLVFTKSLFLYPGWNGRTVFNNFLSWLRHILNLFESNMNSLTLGAFVIKIP